MIREGREGESTVLHCVPDTQSNKQRKRRVMAADVAPAEEQPPDMLQDIPEHRPHSELLYVCSYGHQAGADYRLPGPNVQTMHTHGKCRKCTFQVCECMGAENVDGCDLQFIKIFTMTSLFFILSCLDMLVIRHHNHNIMIMIFAQINKYMIFT